MTTSASADTHSSPWPGIATTALRVAFGIIWMVAAAFTWLPDFAAHYVGYLHNAAQGQPGWNAWWFAFWIGLVTPHAALFTLLTRLAVSAIAIALVIGFGGRTLYALGALFSLLVWSTAEGFGGPYAVGVSNIGTAVTYVLIFLALIGLHYRAGLVPYSLDYLIERRWPRWQKVAEWSGASTPPPAWLDALLAQPGFAVYRNTVAKGCIDALQANYPAVHALVGTDWLRAAAHAFVHQHPPSDGRLMDYGAGFAEFLEGFGPAASLPYLGAVARLDRCWTESHLAADAPALQAAWLAQQAPEALARLRLQPHPAARWQWCAEHPAYRLWQCQRDGLPWDAHLPWQGEGALLTRPHDAVQWAPLPHAGCALLDACAAGATFEDAAAQALQADPAADLPALVALLLRTGALRAPEPC